MKNSAKIVLVGLGKMGKNHFRVAHSHPQFELVAVVDPEVAKVTNTYEGVPVVASLDELKTTDYSAAVVAVPTSLHYEIVKKLILSKKNVLVEKPLASEVAQCEELRALASEHGVKVGVGHVERFNPAVRKVAELIQQGWLGEPIHFSITRVGGYPNTILDKNNVILDLAVHDIDVVLNLLGPLKLVSSICHNTLQSRVIDTAEIMLVSERGTSVALHVNWITPTKIRTMRVTGTRSVCFVDYILQTCQLLGGQLLSYTPDKDFDFRRIVESYQNTDKIDLGVQKSEPLRIEYDHFHRYLIGEPTDICLVEDATAVVSIAHAAIQGAIQANHANSH
jgi:UDP-N-acetylglucosamine 3-dehydrogenase